MRCLALVLLMSALPAAAQSRAPRPHAPRPPAPLPISGEWLWGVGSEPRPGPMQAVAHCGSRPAVLHIVERAGAVTAEAWDATPMLGGAVRPLPSFSTSVTEKLSGTFDGVRLTLAGTHDVIHQPLAHSRPAPDGGGVQARVPADVHEPVRLELRFVPRTGHFVGTRNGVAVWMARGTIIQGTGSCPP
jgi:hypothetical protein